MSIWDKSFNKENDFKYGEDIISNSNSNSNRVNATNPVNPFDPYNKPIIVDPLNPFPTPFPPPPTIIIPEPKNINSSLFSAKLYNVAINGTLIRNIRIPSFDDISVKCDCCQKNNLVVYIHQDKLDLCMNCTERILENHYVCNGNYKHKELYDIPKLPQ